MRGQDLEFLSYGPSPGEAGKLVILLHGYGRNATYMQKMTEEILARGDKIAVIVPQAPEVMDSSGMDSGEGHFLHVPQELRQGDIVYDRATARQWFAIDGSLKTLFPRIAQAAEMMNSFIDAQRDRFSLKDRDIVVMGFSQGAGLALYTAFTRQKEIAGLVAHSTILLEQPGGDTTTITRPRTLFLYGRNDPEFPQDVYEESFRRINAYTGGKTEVKTITGLGHFTNAESRAVCADFIVKVLA